MLRKTVVGAVVVVMAILIAMVSYPTEGKSADCRVHAEIEGMEGFRRR